MLDKKYSFGAPRRSLRAQDLAEVTRDEYLGIWTDSLIRCSKCKLKFTLSVLKINYTSHTYTCKFCEKG